MAGNGSYVRVPELGWLTLVVLTAMGLLSPNPSLTLAVWWTVPLFVALLWRRYEPPILLFAVSIQWVAVTTKVFHANIIGVSVSELFLDDVIIEAIVRGLVGLIVLALGMRVALMGLPAKGRNELWVEARGLSETHVWYAYWLALILGIFLQGIIWSTPRLAQILLPVFNIKWVFFFLLAVCVFTKKRGYFLLWSVVGVEVIIGFSGYFSGFKQVFFVLTVAYLTMGKKLRGTRLFFVAAICAIVFSLSVVWMAVRDDYRYFVSGGTRMQVVTVSVERRLTKLINLIRDASGKAYIDGIEGLANRIAYVDMFANVLNYVPSVMPHEDGRLWGKAIRHILIPRILFPEKGRLESDSELTMKYTGLRLASYAQGTSVSMGYMTESYIDFGPIWMYFPVFVIGALWGGMYRYFITSGRSIILNYGTAVAVLINANQFEMHSTKLIGSMVMSFIVMALLLKFVLPRLSDWMTDPVRVTS